MRITLLGRILMGVSIAALGGLLLGLHDFAAAWPPLPKWMPFTQPLTLLCGAILLLGGLGLLLPRTARPAALAVAAFLALRIALMKIPVAVTHPLLELAWYDICESLALVAGAWTVFALAAARPASVRIGQILFGLSLPALGLSHIFYVNLTAPLIPGWLPFHVVLAWLTGVAHIAAGLAILTGVLSRLAATLEAVMVSLFTLIIWVPLLASAPTSPDTLSEFCISLAITGTAWIIAGSYETRRSIFARG